MQRILNYHYKGISNNQFDPRGGITLKSIAYAYLLSDYSKQKLNIQKRCFRIPGLSRNFHGFPVPKLYSKTFQAWNSEQ